MFHFETIKCIIWAYRPMWSVQTDIQLTRFWKILQQRSVYVLMEGGSEWVAVFRRPNYCQLSATHWHLTVSTWKSSPNWKLSLTLACQSTNSTSTSCMAGCFRARTRRKRHYKLRNDMNATTFQCGDLKMSTRKHSSLHKQGQFRP